MKEKILIENGTIIDGTGSKEYVDSVLIENGIISAIGKNAEAFSNDATLKKINATGQTVMPGLIDSHCHITFDEPTSNDELFFHRREGLAAIVAAHNARKVLLSGVTGFLDADCIFDTGVDLRDAIESGYVEGPRMSSGGNALLTSVGGTAGRLIPDDGLRGYAKVVHDKDDIVKEIRRQIKNGVDWIKIHVTGLVPRQKNAGEISAWSYEELKLACDVAHDLGVPVVGHCRNAKSIIDSVNAGMDMVLHATFMNEEAFETVCEHKTPLVPTFTFQANLADFGEKVGADERLKDIFRREIEESSEMLKRVHDAGVPILCGTESGFSLTPYGEWHYREMEVFVKEIGLTNLEAIQCATQKNSFALKMEGKVGTIEKGMLADILIVDGNPLDDITILGNKSKLSHIFLDGKEVDQKNKVPNVEKIPGWRVSPYSSSILTQDLAKKDS